MGHAQSALTVSLRSFQSPNVIPVYVGYGVLVKPLDLWTTMLTKRLNAGLRLATTQMRFQQQQAQQAARVPRLALVPQLAQVQQAHRVAWALHLVLVPQLGQVLRIVAWVPH